MKSTRSNSAARSRGVLGVALGCAMFCGAEAADAATITVINNDAAGQGFNSTTSATPVGGNPGTTRGAQALNAFQYAADVLGALIYSEIEIFVEARFSPSPPLDCDASSGTLGGAGPLWIATSDLVNDHPEIDLWYAGALYNRLTGTSDPGFPIDIAADFNGRIGQAGCLPTDSWYFGFDANGGANTIDLVTVVLHELSHGLGFLTFADENGVPFMGTLDVFMVYTYDNTQARYWYQMTNAQRATSTENPLNVVFAGPRTVPAAGSFLTAGKDPSGRPLLYTPPAYEVGSSVAHFSTTTFPNTLMEPASNDDLDHTVNDIDITLEALQDMGWRDPGCNNGLLEGSEECDNGVQNSSSMPNACRTTCENASCGDGVTDSGEQCDDGAQNSNNPGFCRPGCFDFICGDSIIDTGEECDNGGANANTPNACRTNCQNPECGDSIVDTSEECDNGGANANAPNVCRTNCQNPECGDGITDSGEQCDDGVGNSTSPDACRPGCIDPICGDSVVDSGEECDNGGANANAPNACRTSCQDPGCGDGILDNGEQCDNGGANANTPNACRLSCQNPSCGDGVSDNGEECDDGIGNGNTPDACRVGCFDPVCGDAVVDSGEECDAGGANANAPDACRPGCVDPACGDGILDSGEECDDAAANEDSPNACRLNCQNPSCGDGIVDTGEECDQAGANQNSADTCRLDCQNPACGDGIVDNGEACDDGASNGNAPDACRASCVSPACGDGVLDTGEQCDEGDVVAGDGCDASCQSEPEPSDGGLGGGGMPAGEADAGLGDAAVAAGGQAGASNAGAANAGSGNGAGAGNVAGVGNGAGGSSGMAGAAGQQGISGNSQDGMAGDGSSLDDVATTPSSQTSQSSGCGCRTVGTRSPWGSSLALGLTGGLLLFFRRRRRWATSLDGRPRAVLSKEFTV